MSIQNMPAFLSNGNAEFQQDTAGLVDQSPTLAHVAFTNSMLCLACALFLMSNLNEAYRGPGNGFCAGVRIDYVLFVGTGHGARGFHCANRISVPRARSRKAFSLVRKCGASIPIEVLI